jgi:predicted transcriptional regulator/transcriptional regulator with XRE-family HTH domain
MKHPKKFAGAILKATRKHHSLTQKTFASRLGLSVPYLNQMEKNKRPLSSKAALALDTEFGVLVEDFAVAEADRLHADMIEVLSDPVFGDVVPDPDAVQLSATNTPDIARAFLRLHTAYRQTQEQLASVDDALTIDASALRASPWEEVRDFFHYCDNYLDDVDIAAEEFAHACNLHKRRPMAALTEWLSENHNIRVTTRATPIVRNYSPSSHTLTLSSLNDDSTQVFQVLHQIALIQYYDLIQSTLDMAGFQSNEAQAIARIGIANYFAGAALMPYGSFQTALSTYRHDIEQVAQIFGASIEQVAHRLSTLQRPNHKGIPFFFVRVDQAGTITKRHSATRLQFARFGGACPLWNVHRAFETQGQFLRQLASTPDGNKYLCLARDITKSSGSFKAPKRRYAIGLGCEVHHAPALVYADDLDIGNPEAFEPIGISCRICERTNCHQRSVPPLERRLTVNENIRGLLPYSLPSR